MGIWLYLQFAQGVSEATEVYPVGAYVDPRGNFVVCVVNRGPHGFYGRWVVDASRGAVAEVELYVPPGGRAAARGSLNGSFTPGTTPVLTVVTGGGCGHPLTPVVVPDVSSVSC